MLVRDVVDFQSEVIERSHTIPVLVDFWAEWCAPCRMLGPVLERMAARHEGRWELAKVNTEALPEVSAQYGIRSIPNVKLFVEGRPVDEFTGALPEQAIEQWLAKALPDSHGDALAAADAAFRVLDVGAARDLLQQIVTERPDHAVARVRLAALLVHEDAAAATTLVGDLYPEGADGERAEAVRTLGTLLPRNGDVAALPSAPVRDRFAEALAHLTAMRFDEALDAFIDVLRTDRYYNDDASRKICIALFKLLGEDHDVTLRHRRDFDRAF
jgi:putative thioredoxin